MSSSLGAHLFLSKNSPWNAGCTQRASLYYAVVNVHVIHLLRAVPSAAIGLG